jgi:hypothetical protein
VAYQSVGICVQTMPKRPLVISPKKNLSRLKSRIPIKKGRGVDDILVPLSSCFHHWNLRWLLSFANFYGQSIGRICCRSWTVIYWVFMQGTEYKRLRTFVSGHHVTDDSSSTLGVQTSQKFVIGSQAHKIIFGTIITRLWLCIVVQQSAISNDWKCPKECFESSQNSYF